MNPSSVSQRSSLIKPAASLSPLGGLMGKLEKRLDEGGVILW